MLARSGIISDDDLEQIERGLAAVREEIEQDRFVVKDDDEDVHMAIERRLTELAGPGRRQAPHRAVAQRPGRHRRRDAGARARARRAVAAARADGARWSSWPSATSTGRCPGYTHLQRAQPVYLSHHLLAYFWKFRRDLQRFSFCLTATDDLPLGAGALAGVNFDTSRMFVAQELGLRRHRRELARRRLQPRLRARLPERGRHLRRAPVPARRRDRALVDRRVRVLPSVGLVRLGIEPDAPEAQPRRGRAAAREGAAAGRAAGRRCTACSTGCR